MISPSPASGGPLTVISATASPNTDNATITATYVVQAPGNTAWSAADNGNYTIALNNTVTDAASNHVTADPNFGTLSVNIGSTATGPTAVLTPPAPITTAGGTTANIVVTYTDAASPIQVSTIVPR